MQELKKGKEYQMDRMEAKLHPVEITSYFVIWISVVCYGIYRVYDIGHFFRHNQYTEDFSTAWLWNGKRDITDFEWNEWKPILLNLAPWFAVHLIGAEFCRWFNVKLLPVWYFVLPSLFLISHFGTVYFLSLLLQPSIFFLISIKCLYKTVTWMTGLMIVAVLQLELVQNWLNLPENVSYLLHVAQGWMNLRCLSYCLDVQSGFAKPTSPIKFLAYCFYLPVLLLGPVILYSNFEPSIEQRFTPWTWTRFFKLLFGIIRYCFWMFVLEVWLHLIYSNALAMQPRVVWGLDAWTLYGLGYCLGQYFMIKYTVVYGIPGVLAQAEGVNSPSPPKCIGRMHMYSEVWRTFDQGLYFFLSRYIYMSIAKDRNNLSMKIFASFLCFCFVYLWHGIRLYVLIWSTLNFLGVVTETLAYKVAALPTFKSWQNRWLSPRGIRRFHALLAAPLLYMSALSNFYFLASLQIGDIFMGRAMQGWMDSTLVVLLVTYCCSQVSIEIKYWERKNKPEKDKNDLD